jgi:hypothetical protein
MRLGPFHRGPSLKELNAEAQTLMNTLMDEAQARLKAEGGFPPFAAWLGAEDAPSLLRRDEEAGMPAREIVERLTGDLRSKADNGGVRVAALAADVRFGKAGSGDLENAVRLHIEHQDGYCADIFVPYKIRNSWRPRPGAQNRVHFSHPVAQESERRFWTIAEDVN